MGMVTLLLIMAMPAYCAAATDKGLEIVLDGTKIEAVACIDKGNIYLPLRAVGEALGYEVLWSGIDNTVSVIGTGKNIMIDLNNQQITADGHVYYVDSELIVGRLYLGSEFFSSELGLAARWDRKNKAVQLERVERNLISIETIKEVAETDEIRITLQYPQIGGLTNETVQDRINRMFKEAADEARQEGLKNAEEKEKAGASGYGSPNRYETYFDYSLKCNQKGLLSVVLMNYQYTGGAHGSMVQSSYTFNLNTGEEYTLKDLFKDDADYVAYINNTVKGMIVERVREEILPEYDIEPFETIRDDHDFYLSNDGVVIYFQQYEHWCYAAGIQEFTVEYAALKEMLKPEVSLLNNSIAIRDSGSSTVVAIETKPEGPTEESMPNPHAALPLLTWSDVKPQLPNFTAWEYVVQPGSPLDIKELLSRIWAGQEYESYDHGEHWMCYRLPLYQSKYGQFREQLDTYPSGFSYQWEINENYPQREVMGMSPEQAFKRATAYAREFLGSDQYLEYPVPFAVTIDEDGKRVNFFYEFNWEHRIGSVPVYGEGLSLRVIPQGIPQLRLSWSTFAPQDTRPQYQPLTFDQALYSLNYVRSYVDPNKCSDHNAGDFLVAAQVVYSNRFSADLAVYRPAWEFTLSRSNGFYTFPVLVDCLTGKVSSDHDGIVDSYLMDRAGQS